MFKDLLVNASFLITMLFLGSQMFINTGISRTSPLKRRALLGAAGGVSCIILAYYGFHINSGTILDFRLIPEVVTAVFGGTIAIVITAVISISFRLIYFGVSAYSIVTSSGIAIVALSYVVFSALKIRINRKSIFLMGIWGLIIRSIAFILLIDRKSILTEVLISLWAGTAILSIIVYYLIQYLITAQNLMLKLKENAGKDFLTGLNNSRSFDIYFNSYIKNSLENGKKLSFLMLDIDFFKKVNDTYGHPIGDFILKEFGKIIVSSCRSIDVVSRIGGEEFSVLLPDCSLNKTFEVAERIRINVQNHDFITENHDIIHITVSIGAAVYPDTTDNVDRISKRADEGLYKAKQSGRNKVCLV